MTGTVADALAWYRARLGYRGDGREFADLLDMPVTAWCAEFFSAGQRVARVPGEWASTRVTLLWRHYRPLGRTGHQPRVGAGVCFDWSIGNVADGSFSHIGVLERILSDGRLQTIEGNTTPGGGQPIGVYRMVRSTRFVRGYLYPAYSGGGANRGGGHGGSSIRVVSIRDSWPNGTVDFGGTIPALRMRREPMPGHAQRWPDLRAIPATRLPVLTAGDGARNRLGGPVLMLKRLLLHASQPIVLPSGVASPILTQKDLTVVENQWKAAHRITARNSFDHTYTVGPSTWASLLGQVVRRVPV